MFTPVLYLLCAVVVSSSVYVAEPDLERAFQLLQRERFGEAHDALRIFLRDHTHHPETPTILYWLGRTARDTTLVLPYYRTILDSYPKSDVADDALYALAQYYYALGDRTQAVHHFKKLLSVYPRSEHVTACHYWLGLLLKDDTLSAISHFKKVPPGDALWGPLAAIEISHLSRSVIQEMSGALSTSETTPVTVTTASHKLGSTHSPSVPSKEARYTVQVAALSDSVKAVALYRRLVKKGYTVLIDPAWVSGKRLYRVRVGSFATLEQATNFSTKMRRRERLSTYVVER
jgi:tetratricopeptide (TPR) repeat protein